MTYWEAVGVSLHVFAAIVIGMSIVVYFITMVMCLTEEKRRWVGVAMAVFAILVCIFGIPALVVA